MASTIHSREGSQRCSWLVYRDALPKDQVSEYKLCAADLHDLSDLPNVAIQITSLGH